MTIQQIQRLLRQLNEKGFIESKRRGPTGIGHTLEQELHLKENNIAIPDLGGTVELKATRKGSNTLITLFTFNRTAWIISQKEVIEKYGYIDDTGRKALYNVVKVNEINSQGLTLTVDKKKQTVNLVHKATNTTIGIWSIYAIVGKFLNKLARLLFVMADIKVIKGTEHFHYNNAVILTEPTAEKFLDAFDKGIVCIDLRMHLKENNSVRNRGTGFRVVQVKLPDLYGKAKQLI